MTEQERIKCVTDLSYAATSAYSQAANPINGEVSSELIDLSNKLAKEAKRQLDLISK